MYRVENINKSFEDLKVLEDISIDFVQGGMTCILGPSGCGKTTILNIISGIDNADSGQVIAFPIQTFHLYSKKIDLSPGVRLWRTSALS